MNDDVKDSKTDAEEEIDSQKRTKFGRIFVLSGFVVSVFLGGTLGVIGSKIFAGPDKTIALRAEFQQNLDELRKSTQNQTQRLGTTANSVQKSESRLDTLQAENQALANLVETLEQTIFRLQNETADDLKTLTDRMAVLEALSGENADIFTGTDSIAARLNALEENALKAPPLTSTVDETAAQSPEETDATTMNALNAADSTRITAKPPVDASKRTALTQLIDTFPRAKMLAAVKAQEQGARKKTGWLKRALSKHIRVGNDNAPNPYIIIDAAETALKNGQITKALEQLAQLNPPVRASAAAWMQTAKKAALNIE